MKPNNEPKRWAIICAAAAVLLIIWSTALGERPPLIGPSIGNSPENDAARIHVTDPVLVSEELVRLEDSLQWQGRDPVKLPVSLSVTDLLPARC